MRKWKNRVFLCVFREPKTAVVRKEGTVEKMRRGRRMAAVGWGKKRGVAEVKSGDFRKKMKFGIEIKRIL